MATDILAQAGFSAPDILAQAEFSAPDFGKMGSWLVYFLIAVVVACFIAFGVYLLILHLKFNKKVVLFRKVAQRIIPVATDKGMIQRIGIAGDTWLRTKKFKKILPRPKIEMEKNTYWYYEREDGEWINFNIEDIDRRMKEANSYFVDEDMRLQRLGIQRNLKDRFDKPGFWDKYGVQVVMVIFFLIVTICLVVIFNKMNDLIKALPQLAKALESLANSIASQGSRMVPVSPGPINATGGVL